MWSDESYEKRKEGEGRGGGVGVVHKWNSISSKVR